MTKYVAMIVTPIITTGIETLTQELTTEQQFIIRWGQSSKKCWAGMDAVCRLCGLSFGQHNEYRCPNRDKTLMLTLPFQVSVAVAKALRKHPKFFVVVPIE